MWLKPHAPVGRKQWETDSQAAVYIQVCLGEPNLRPGEVTYVIPALEHPAIDNGLVETTKKLAVLETSPQASYFPTIDMYLDSLDGPIYNRAVPKPPVRPANIGLGSFQVLPLEVFHIVVGKLDLHSIEQFAQVCEEASERVFSHHMYRRIYHQAHDVVRCFRLFKPDERIPLRQLYKNLGQSRCCYCDQFGGYLYLHNCTRVCSRFHWLRLKLCYDIADRSPSMLPVFQGDHAEGGVEITLANIRLHRALLENARFFYEHVRPEPVLNHSDVMIQWNDIGQSYTGELAGEDARAFHRVLAGYMAGTIPSVFPTPEALSRA